MDRNLIIKLANTTKKTLPKDYTFNWSKLPENIIIQQIINKFGPKMAYVVCGICSEANNQAMTIDEAYDFVSKNVEVIFYVSFGAHTNRYECGDCEGSGADYCEVCNDGYNSCSNCDGNGEFNCDDCGGDGYDDEDQTCNTCNGSGIVECDDCNGDGTIECDYCRGNGTIECDSCDGNGTIRDSTHFITFNLKTFTTTRLMDINSFKHSVKDNIPLDLDDYYMRISDLTISEYYINDESDDELCYLINPVYSKKKYGLISFNILDDFIQIRLAGAYAYANTSNIDYLLRLIEEKYTIDDE